MAGGRPRGVFPVCASLGEFASFWTDCASIAVFCLWMNVARPLGSVGLVPDQTTWSRPVSWPTGRPLSAREHEKGASWTAGCAGLSTERSREMLPEPSGEGWPWLGLGLGLAERRGVALRPEGCCIACIVYSAV